MQAKALQSDQRPNWGLVLITEDIHNTAYQDTAQRSADTAEKAYGLSVVRTPLVRYTMGHHVAIVFLHNAIPQGYQECVMYTVYDYNTTVYLAQLRCRHRTCKLPAESTTFMAEN